ncbi:hypothetical protein AB0K60_29470 [Thermopolyspora sp. NPDC052614]|uniref:hypothetical protein n=1 Tax=Thermopolyspora sp. NPDC052614 TaxID=3155682 RepID=UPI003440EBDA
MSEPTTHRTTQPPTQPPTHVRGLAEQRARARADRDYAQADVLRAAIEEAGWLVRDTDEGFELAPKPPFPVWPAVASLPVPALAEDRRDEPGRTGRKENAAAAVGTEETVAAQVLWDGSLATSRINESVDVAGAGHATEATDRVTVGLIIDGRPSDVRKCVDGIVAHTDARILALDLGNIDGAGTVLHELAAKHPGRIDDWHVAETPHWRGGTAGWGAARTKLLHMDDADVHVVMETSTILDGDALTPLAEALTGDVVAAGWRGVDPGEDGHDWHDAGPGEVRALLGHLFAVRRDRALEAGGFPAEARYHRNADLEFFLGLPGRKIVPATGLPVHAERHCGHEDVDPGYRDRESRRTYDRVLSLLRTA